MPIKVNITLFASENKEELEDLVKTETSFRFVGLIIQAIIQML